MKRIMDLQSISFLRERLFSFSWKEKRVFFVFLATAFVVLSLCGFILLGLERMEREEKQISLLEKKTKGLITSIKRKNQFLEECRKSDGEFLKNSIESFDFLKKDREILSKIEDKGYLPIQARVEYLSGEENRLKFIDKKTRQLHEYKEIDWALDHGVELNKGDLMSLVSSIEANAPLKPQLIIKKIDLKQIKGTPIFSLDLEVLQRGLNDAI